MTETVTAFIQTSTFLPTDLTPTFILYSRQIPETRGNQRPVVS